jgi:hypothetical protein
LLCLVVLTFRRSFFSLAIDLRIFPCLSAAAVSFAEPFLAPCLLCHHHHRHSQILAAQQVVLGVSCFLCSCLHQSFELCSPLLICCVRRFRNERGFIPLRRMVVISICLCRNVLLGFLLWWHRELFFG